MDPIFLVNSLERIEDESLTQRVGYARYLQGGKRLKMVFDNNDKIYTHSF